MEGRGRGLGNHGDPVRWDVERLVRVLRDHPCGNDHPHRPLHQRPAAAVHPVFSGPARERIQESGLETLFVTNTIPLDDAMSSCRKIRTLSVAPLLGEAIQRIHEGASVSSLFV